MAITLLSIDLEAEVRIKTISSTYKDLCTTIDADQLSNSRVRDPIGTLDMFGLIGSDERNLGRRGGRTSTASSTNRASSLSRWRRSTDWVKHSPLDGTALATARKRN